MRINHFILVLFFIFPLLTITGQTIQTLVLQPGPETGIDAEVRTDMDWPIWYEDDFIANAWTVQGNPFIERSLLKFDLSELPANISIISAKLELYSNTMSGHHQLHAGNNACYLERITEPWDPFQVTWNTQPSTTNHQSVILPQTDTTIQDYTDIDITDMIRFFAQNPDQNFGFMFKLIEEVQFSAMVFSSSNHTDPLKRPKLTIQYSSCDSLDADFKYIKLNNSNLVHFTADSVEGAEYWWDFGNGYYSSEISPLFFYFNPGNYNVCLTVNNSCSENTFCDSIKICTDVINGSFTYKTEGNFVEFTPITATDKVRFFWDFGDGFFSNEERPVHYFKEPAKYNVCLYASNYCDQLLDCDTIQLDNNQVKNSNQSLSIYPNPSSGLVKINPVADGSSYQHIRVINFNGTEILNEGHYRLRKSNGGYSCDFSGMETGIYTIQVITDIGVFTQKAVVVAQ